MVYQQLRIAFKTVALQRIGKPSSHPTRIHPLQVRTFASTPRAEAAENPNFKQTPLFQQLAANPEALVCRVSSLGSVPATDTYMSYSLL
jgi:hypothetical protein